MKTIMKKKAITSGIVADAIVVGLITLFATNNQKRR
jgi:hypothetical protein